MISELKEIALANHNKLEVVPIERLTNLKCELAEFKESEELNSFQKWIVNDLYQLEIPKANFPIRSIVIVAIPHPAYSKVEFVNQGKQYEVISLAMSDFDKTDKFLNDFIAAKGYHLQPAPKLPLKRLAVESGLAAYGRNNICYVEGMGSFLSFAAYFSDIPVGKVHWEEVHMSDCCNHCGICLNSCPTGALIKDRFLIDNERCLSYFNEVPGEFPDWMSPSIHHCIYDCLKCQINCPMNQDYSNQVIGPIKFSEEETDMILVGTPYDEFPLAMKQKVKLLGMDQWLPAIPRNLRILFKNEGTK
jgi:epoxyqueuosine reductase